MNIYEKMLKATAEINKVAKNLKVGVGNSQYKAVGEADVLEAVKPVEIQFGIYSYPCSRKIIDKEVFVKVDEYNGKKTEKNSLWLRIETIYRFVNIEDPKEYIDITTYGDGFDSQDKSPGKAMTYSDKYALLKAYKIITGDDPDQNPSGQIKRKTEKPKSTLPDDRNPTEAEMAEYNDTQIDKVKLAAIEAELERTGVKASQLTKLYKVINIALLTNQQWADAMANFKVTPDKKKSKLDL